MYIDEQDQKFDEDYINITHRKTSFLQTIRDEVKEVDELTEDNAFRCCILGTQIAQFFQESFNFCRALPSVQVQAAENSLSSIGRARIEIQRRCFEVNS